jgi:hypothetical protein
LGNFEFEPAPTLRTYCNLTVLSKPRIQFIRSK